MKNLAVRLLKKAWLRAERLSRHACSGGGAVFLVLAGTACVLAAGPDAVTQQTKPAAPGADSRPGNAENGKRLFTAAGCYECHDRQGQGGTGTGPRLAPNPIAFAAFVHQCRQPADQMPPYTSKVLSDAELQDIYAFLQSIPKPPPASSIPLLQ